jgi:hypothetical protein
MPCYSPPESNNEKESRKVSELILIFNKKMGIVSDYQIEKWSESFYENHCDIVVPMLCEKINSLSEQELDRVVYNGRDKESRRLADWFDYHNEFDKNR